MNATFAPSMPAFGGAGFVSQSGAMGLSVLDYAREYGIGMAQFVSMGNKPDVSGNDMLLYWENDPAISVILMYVENFGNPRRFLEIAGTDHQDQADHRGQVRPLQGRGPRGLIPHRRAGRQRSAVDALMAQAGVLRAGSVEELFDLAMAFSGQPLPKSRRVAVLTNSGGPGILAADALETHGMEVAELDPATIDRIRPLFPEEASIRNPLDMIASATPAGYRAALSALLGDPNIDTAVAIFVPPLGIRQEDVAEAIARVATDQPGKPVLAVLMGREGLPQGKAELHEVKIPAYIFPESAARALSGTLPVPRMAGTAGPAAAHLAVDPEAAAAILPGHGRRAVRKLAEAEVMDLLASYGIPVAATAWRTARTRRCAGRTDMGYPVVLKVVSPRIIHKTEVGGVLVRLAGAEEVRRGYETDPGQRPPG